MTHSSHPLPESQTDWAALPQTLVSPTLQREEPPAASEAPPPHLSIPGYDILGEIGRGGMGIVYRAWQRKLNRVVALKMILGGSLAGQQQVLRFLAEAEAVAGLQHPGIVQIYESGQLDGLPYYSMQYVRGGSLGDRLGDRTLPPREAAQLVEQLARTMAYAHAHGIIHRDLKPENVLLQPIHDRPSGQRRSGETGGSGERSPPDPKALEPVAGEFRLADYVPRVSDFGLAKRLDDETNLTGSRAVLGTPSYMAPEQARNARRAGSAVDVYSLGAILFRLVAGRPPFQGASPAETMMQVVEQEPPRPSRFAPGLPRDLETICLKCLHKDPVRRYPSAAELAEDLRRFLDGEPIRARRASLSERVIKWCRRRPLSAGLLGALVVALVALVVGGVWFAIHLDHAWQEAEQRAGAERLACQAAQREQARAELSETKMSAQLQLTRAQLLTAQLLRVAPLLDRHPGQALDLLLDERACPREERDFTWGHFHRRARWDRATFRGHAAEVTALAFSPDGQTLASGDVHGEVKLWSATGAELQRWQAFQGRVTCLAWSPDSKALAVGGTAFADVPSAQLQVWDVAARRQRAATHWPQAHVEALAWSEAGIAVSDERHVSLRDSATLKEGQRWPWSALVLRFSPSAKTLGAIDAGGHLVLLDPHGGEVRQKHRLPVEPKSAGLIADLSLAVGLSLEGELTFYDVRQKAVLPRAGSGRTSSGPLALSDDGKLLMLGSKGGAVRLWPRDQQEPVLLRSGASQVGNAVVALTAQGELAASAGPRENEPGWITFWHVQPPPERTLSKVGRSFLRPVPGSQEWLSGGLTPTLIDLVKGTARPVVSKELVEQIKGTVLCAAVLPRGQGMLLGTAGSADADQRSAGELLWCAGTRQREVLAREEGGVLCLAVSPDGEWVAAGGGEYERKTEKCRRGHLRLRRLATDDEQLLPAGAWPVGSVNFSPDGRRLAYSANDGVWLAEGAQVRPLLRRPDGVGAVVFSPSGQLLAVVAGQSVLLIEPESGRVRERLTHASPVSALTFSPDGRILAASSQVQIGSRQRVAVQLWDVLSGQERASLSGPATPVQALAFTPDGRTLLGLEQNGDVRLWQAEFPAQGGR